MARRPRVDYDGAVHHVMNRGINHQRIFFGDVDRVRFGRLLADVHERFGIETLAYCLMDNHFHLLVRTPTGHLSDAMKRVSGLHTQQLNDRVGRDGPVFRGRFHSKLVTTDSYLQWLTRYIHRNPLDISGIQHPASYRWSSYRAYLGHRPAAAFINLDVVSGLFGQDRRALEAFTESDVAAVDPHTEHAVDDLVQLIDLLIGCSQLESTTTAAPPWYSRTLLVLLAAETLHPELRAALDLHLNFPSIDARRRSVARARRRVASDATAARLLAIATANVGRRPAAA